MWINMHRVAQPTISTSFSRKGTSFSSSLSFLSMNQLSMGIPLDNCWDNEQLVRKEACMVHWPQFWWSNITSLKYYVHIVQITDVITVSFSKPVAFIRKWWWGAGISWRIFSGLLLNCKCGELDFLHYSQK